MKDCRNCKYATLFKGIEGWVSCSKYWGIEIPHSPAFAENMCNKFKSKK